MSTPNDKIRPRPPVVAVMGHIDHGKSTLLDYIRSTNVVAGETGGITQKISAYEIDHKLSDGVVKKITFLDTPGHEAFSKIRTRGASVADVAILVVSAEDGVKPQTLDALKAIKSAGIPYIIAMNKIDKPNADLNRTKQSLAENEIFVEGYGGDITAVPVSAKTGAGVSDLLDLVALQTDVLGFMSDESKPAEGIVIEAHTEKGTGINATLIIKDGTLKVGNVVVCGNRYAPVRFMENYLGKKIAEATFSSPIRVTGWNDMPDVGDIFTTVKNKKEAEKLIEENESNKPKEENAIEVTSEALIPIIIKADAQGAINAIFHEIKKINNESIGFKVLHAGVGEIRESDVKLATSKEGTVIVGFSVGIDKQADAIRERFGVETKYFGIIYELADYLKEIAVTKKPKKMVEEISGVIKVLKFFSKVKDRQVIGGRAIQGTVPVDTKVRILRRGNEIGFGHLRELQSQKVKVGEISEGTECGISIDAKIEIAPGDELQAIVMVEK